MIDILELREKLFMTQDEFARLIGVTRQTVHNWETGRFEPTQQYKQKMLKILKKLKENM